MGELANLAKLANLGGPQWSEWENYLYSSPTKRRWGSSFASFASFANRFAHEAVGEPGKASHAPLFRHCYISCVPAVSGFSLQAETGTLTGMETTDIQAVGRVVVVPDHHTGDALLRFTDPDGRSYEVRIPADSLDRLAFSVVALVKARS